jgi:ribosomal protein S18 acetylase RimI-like enzyme
MRIRHARYADIEGILGLWRAAEAAPTETDDASSIDRLIHRDRAAFFVAEEDGALVGTLIAGFDGWRGHLYRMAVHPDSRRRGIARALVEEAEDHLRAIGCQRIDAFVLAEEAHAVGFWTACGYASQPEIGRFVKTT